MLILTRRIGESVYIGDEVRLTVLGVRGTQVRLGINAPKDIPVHREEIYYKIKHEQSGGAAPGDPSPGNPSPGNQYGGHAYQPTGNMGDSENAGNMIGDGYGDDHPSPEDADPHNS